jgi:hypothetical protein
MKSKKDLWGDAAGDAGWAMLVPPAPGDLRIVQAMVNTAAATARKMASPQATADCLARWGLLPAATEEVSETDRRRLIDTRDGLRALSRFNNGLPWDAEAVARLNKAAASAPLKVEIGARSTRFEPAFDGVDGAPGFSPGSSWRRVWRPSGGDSSSAAATTAASVVLRCFGEVHATMVLDGALRQPV